MKKFISTKKEKKDEEKSSFMLACAVYVSCITCRMRKLIF
ncbi:hypothetical protein DORLON_02284 [Dorea longicatena DSM 13814]|uniref:Uncharacterized protein n=1 Tax=Dorea longicatena DSM 13814 TaxID=411462 RepID=A6BIZ6_9FIRM|nr:hypothetical protein DORLON_02284 [Dorea longicatena DSM 13814]